MAVNAEKGIDPTVETIVEMFPEDFLRNTARETGVVKRERKIDVYFTPLKTALFISRPTV